MSDAGEPLSNALIGLRSLDLGLIRSTVSAGDGRFTMNFVTPGRYELLVEALGYVPVLAGPISLSPGAEQQLTVHLTRSQGAVASVDTVFTAEGGQVGRIRVGGIQVGTTTITDQPDATESLVSAASLGGVLDPFGGMAGLPASMATLWVDGVAFRPAAHPVQRGMAGSSPAFPRSFVQQLAVLANSPDVEWAGSPGGYIAASSASHIGESSSGGGAFVAGSGSPLWSSSKFGGSPPSKASLWFHGGAGIEIAPDTSRLFVMGDVFRAEIPFAPRLSLADAEGLPSLDPTRAAELTQLGVERLTRASGLARVDWWFSPGRRFSLRASGGIEQREFVNASPVAGPTAPSEATDFSVTGALTSEYSERLTVEARGSVTASSRDFSRLSQLPSAVPASAGVEIGDPSAGHGTASLLEVNFSPVGHYRYRDYGTLKGGFQLRATRNTVDYSPFAMGRFYLPGAGAVDPTLGSYLSTSSRPSTFSTSNVGGFLQYEFEAAPGAMISFGGRVASEAIPTEASLNNDWLTASGIRNDTFPTSYLQVGAHATLRWDIRGDGTAFLFSSASLDQGTLDTGLLHQFYTQDGATTATRWVGQGLSWPGAAPAGATTLPTLTLLGPDIRAPQSSRLSAGLMTHVGDRLGLFARGDLRRTDFLIRRRNLNVSVLPVAEDSHGMPILGELTKSGGLVMPVLGSNRRFTGFDDVWAMDPDGWSEYRAATVGAEYNSPRAGFLIAYTFSETRDNWVGAAAAAPDSEVRPVLPESIAAWDESTSDFDIPQRLVASATVIGGSFSVSAFYTFSDGRPFTAGYRAGVDVNGDGSGVNDVAFVPDATQLGEVLSQWPCLQNQINSFARRNGCRGEGQHSLSARVNIGLGSAGGRRVDLVVDGINLIEPTDGTRDNALLLVDPALPIVRSSGGAIATVPVIVNPAFGSVLVPASRGRVLRLGIRIGG